MANSRYSTDPASGLAKLAPARHIIPKKRLTGARDASFAHGSAPFDSFRTFGKQPPHGIFPPDSAQASNDQMLIE
jgi:hypothetical protein